MNVLSWLTKEYIFLIKIRHLLCIIKTQKLKKNEIRSHDASRWFRQRL